MKYKKYYRELFESYGFKILFKQFTFTRKITSPISERLYYKTKIAMKNSNYNFKHIKINTIKQIRIKLKGPPFLSSR